MSKANLDSPSGSPRDQLLRLRQRILDGAKRGTGCRVTAKEARLLQYYELPNTTEVKCVGE